MPRAAAEFSRIRLRANDNETIGDHAWRKSHQAKLRITCDLEVSQYQKDKGIEIELRANDELLGELKFNGAHVYFRGHRQKKWSHWSFSAFAKLLSDNRNV